MKLISGFKGIKTAPEQIIPGSFFITIIIGALLLTLPVSSASGEHTSFLTALFTATTSVCVTGLVVVDTYSHWSFFGQLIILLLIQIGGLGMITFASMLMILSGKKITLTERVLIQDAFNLDSNSRLLRFLVRVIKGTFLVEGAGAVLYAFVFIPQFGIVKGSWSAIFNSVSAFCNAGMDVIGPNSMGDYTDNPIVMSVTMLLIVMGGIGFVVWFDMYDKLREGIRKGFPLQVILGRLSEHTKLVITFTFVLIFGGMLIFLATEYNNPGTIGELGIGGKLINALFESVTLRTAGFTTFPQENLTTASCFIAYIWMVIGGSPIGTAGGIKTVTMFLLLMNVLTYVRHQDENVIFGRRVSEESMKKAAAVAIVAFFTILGLTFLLSVFNPVPMADALFEVVSACGTVGLSRALTPSLGTMGRLIIITAMFLGRIGPISLIAFFSRSRADKNKIKYSEGIFYVG